MTIEERAEAENPITDKSSGPHYYWNCGFIAGFNAANEWIDKYGVIKKGYMDAGKPLRIIGPEVELNGMFWTPVEFRDEEDPIWFKSSGIEIDPEGREWFDIIN